MNGLPDPEFAGAFFLGAAEHRLLIDRCQDCGFWIHHPRPMCPQCLATNVAPEEVSGTGTVAGHAVAHRPPVPADPVDLPVMHVLVELDEQPGLRVASTLVGGARPEIGQRVEVVFDDVGGVVLPRFRPVEV